jgi:dihydroflavonol-4-reductase
MRVFVTGGGGFIGSVVVRRLVELGHEVVCLVRPTSLTTRLEGVAHERAVGDVRDLDSLRRAMRGATGVVHLASLSSWDLIDSPEMPATVEGGTRNVLRAALEGGSRPRVVFVSSLTAVGATEEPRALDESAEFNLTRERGLVYAQAKRRAEGVCAEFHRAGLPVVIVNPGEVYGPNDHALVTAATLLDFARSSPVLVCRGGVSVVHVDDVALGIVSALERGRSGERYILGGENLTVREIAALTLELVGIKRRIVSVPNVLIRAVTKVATTLAVPLPYNPKLIPYVTRFWFADTTKARRELGVTFRPARDTLAATIEWLGEVGHIQKNQGNGGQAPKPRASATVSVNREGGVA